MNELDLLVAQLVADEKTKFLDEFVQIHGRELGLSGAGEGEDLLDDFVEVLDFVAEDLGVLGAGIGLGKLEVEGVVEHLHHREGIADFVGDLGGKQPERGEFFVLAQLFLNIHDPLVEPRLFNGEGVQFRERGENADFLVGELITPAGIDIEGSRWLRRRR